jgi:WD40 repeat protein
MKSRYYLYIGLISIFLAGCNAIQPTQISAPPEALPTQTMSSTATVAPSATPTSTPIPTQTSTPVPTPTLVFPFLGEKELPEFPLIQAENAKNLRLISVLGRGMLHQVLMSRDQQSILALTHSGIFRYNPETLELLEFTDLNILALNREFKYLFVKMSPDEKYLVYNGARMQKAADHLTFVTLPDMTPVFSRTGISAAFANDGKTAAVSSREEVALISLVDQSAIMKIPADFVAEMTFSSDDHFLTTYSSIHNMTQVWELPAGRLVKRLIGARGLAFSPDGSLFGASNSQGLIELYETQTWKIVFSLKDSQYATDLAFLPDGKNFILAYQDSRLEIRSSADGALIQQIPGFPINNGGSVFFSPNGSQLNLGWNMFWDPRKGGFLYNGADPIFQGAYSLDGKTYASVDPEGGNLALHNSADGSKLKTPGKFPGSTAIGALLPDGHTLTLTNNYGIMWWDFGKGEIVNAEEINRVTSQAVSLTGEMIAAAYYQSTQNPESGVNLYQGGLRGTIALGERVNGMAFSRDGTKLAICTDDAHLYLADVSSKQRSGPYDCQCKRTHDQKAHLYFTPDDQLVSCSDRLLEVKNGNPITVFPADLGGEIMDSALSFNGKLFVTSSWDGILRLWGVYP